MIKKVVYFFAWIGIFILSCLGVIYSVLPGWAPRLIGKFITLTPGRIRAAIFIISTVYFLLCLLKIKFRSKKSENYEIRTTDGIVTVSPQIITNYIKQSLNEDEDIKNLKVETFRNEKKFDIKIKTDLTTNGNVAEKSIYIQNKIKREVTDKIGITIGDVEVRISKYTNKPAQEVVSEPSGISTSEKLSPESPKSEPLSEKIDPNDSTPEITENEKEKRSFLGFFKRKAKKPFTEELKTEEKLETENSIDDNNFIEE
jgi:uncharacterized alkaline shock family protein YloU